MRSLHTKDEIPQSKPPIAYWKNLLRQITMLKIFEIKNVSTIKQWTFKRWCFHVGVNFVVLIFYRVDTHTGIC